MKCIKCGTENNSDAKFCRNCGALLNTTTDKAELVRKYLLSAVKKKKNIFGGIVLLILGIYSLVICVSGAIFFIFNNGDGLLGIAIIAGLLFLYFTGLLYVCILKVQVSGKVDLIQKITIGTMFQKYRLFMKNEKMGLIKNNRIVIPPIYDELSWKIYGTCLNVDKNGEKFMVDVHNNRTN